VALRLRQRLGPGGAAPARGALHQRRPPVQPARLRPLQAAPRHGARRELRARARARGPRGGGFVRTALSGRAQGRAQGRARGRGWLAVAAAAACVAAPLTAAAAPAAGSAPVSAPGAGAGAGTRAAAAGGTAIAALGRTATASSTEGPFGAALAVDGDPQTRWSSEPADPQWIRVDLGSVQDLCGIELVWEAAY